MDLPIWTVGVTTLCKIIPEGCFEYRTDLEVTDTGVTVCDTVWTGWFDPAWTGLISLLVGWCTRWIGGWLVTVLAAAVVTITEVDDDPFRVGFSSVLFDGAGGSVSGGGAWAFCGVGGTGTDPLPKVLFLFWSSSWIGSSLSSLITVFWDVFIGWAGWGSEGLGILASFLTSSSALIWIFIIWVCRWKQNWQTFLSFSEIQVRVRAYRTASPISFLSGDWWNLDGLRIVRPCRERFDWSGRGVDPDLLSGGRITSFIVKSPNTKFFKFRSKEYESYNKTNKMSHIAWVSIMTYHGTNLFAFDRVSKVLVFLPQFLLSYHVAIV